MSDFMGNIQLSLCFPLVAMFSLSLSLSPSLHVRLDWVSHLNGEAGRSTASTHCVMYAAEAVGAAAIQLPI